MAVSIPDGLGKNSVWFALSYAVIRIILVIEYLRTRRHVPAARQLTTRYCIGFSIAAGIWFVSTIVPPPIRYILWIIGLGVDICTPVLLTRQFQVQFAPNVHHLPERFGSFTIIVLGILVLGVVNGIAPHNWTLPSIISAGLGLGIAFGLWWIYFDTVDGSEIKALRDNKQIGIYVTWLFIHFPLIVGLTAFGVSVEHIVLSNQDLALPSSEKWLLGVSIFLCLVALGTIQMTSAITTPMSSSDNSRKATKYVVAIYSIVAAVALFALVLTLSLLPVFLIGMVGIASTALVVMDVKRHSYHRFPKF